MSDAQDLVKNMILEDLLLKGVDFEEAISAINSSSDTIYIYQRLGLELPESFQLDLGIVPPLIPGPPPLPPAKSSSQPPITLMIPSLAPNQPSSQIPFQIPFPRSALVQNPLSSSNSPQIPKPEEQKISKPSEMPVHKQPAISSDKKPVDPNFRDFGGGSVGNINDKLVGLSKEEEIKREVKNLEEKSVSRLSNSVRIEKTNIESDDFCCRKIGLFEEESKGLYCEELPEKVYEFSFEGPVEVVGDEDSQVLMDFDFERPETIPRVDLPTKTGLEILSDYAHSLLLD